MRVMWRGILLAGLGFFAWVASDGVLADASYTYDDLGRLVRVENSAGTIVVYDYDAAGNRTQKSVSITNYPPAAGSDSIGVTAGIAYDFDPRANDSDPESGALTITGKTDGAKGTVVILNGGTALRYTAGAATGGADKFTYVISDPAGAQAMAAVSVMITNPSNHAPVANDDSEITFFGDGVTFDPRTNDSDADGDPLTITNVSTPTNGGTAQKNSTGTRITYLAKDNSAYTDTFNYTISDGLGGTATATVTITNYGGTDPCLSQPQFC